MDGENAPRPISVNRAHRLAVLWTARRKGAKLGGMRTPIRVSVGLVSLLLVRAGFAQEALDGAPRMGHVARLGSGLSGELRLADGSSREFYLEVSATRALLARARTAKDPTNVLAVGSEEEAELLTSLRAWAKAKFTAGEAATALAMERLPDPKNEREDLVYRQQTLLRDLQAYEEVTRPRITKVFAGRGTVSLSLQIQLADRAPRQLLWRRFGDEPFARLHFDTDVDPLPMEGRDERKLLLAMRIWLVGRVGEAGVWEQDAVGVGEDVRLVLQAYRSYCKATSPRLRWVSVTMDQLRGGSVECSLTDERNRPVRVRFDHAAKTQTPGRMIDALRTEVIEIGSDRERVLLAALRRAIELRRSGVVTGEGEVDDLEVLEKELAAYDATFHAAPRAK